MLSTKNYNNNSSIFANTAKFNKLECDQAEISNYPSINYLNSSIQDVYDTISNTYYNRTESDNNMILYLDNYYIKSEVDGKVTSSYNQIMVRLDNFHYTISQLTLLYYYFFYL
jgi:hypothetical protein